MKQTTAFFYLMIFIFLPLISQAQTTEIYKDIDYDRLADGSRFPFWEQETRYSKTYHVARNHSQASDENPGTRSKPFKTISAAARVLQPGEKVIIHKGVYRESIHPARGGAGPDKLICYQAATGEKVIVKGSVVLKPEKWEPGTGWYYNPDSIEQSNVWQYDLRSIDFNGYNPFGMLNLLHDREHFQYKREVNMRPHFKRRGMLFLDGELTAQVLKPVALHKQDSAAFWVEHNGLTIHLRLPEGKSPQDYRIEAVVKEQLVRPKTYGLAYIKLKGISFMHAANGFPVPQRGMISSNRGNHWIIEDCEIKWANALGIDLGNEMWDTKEQPELGYHIVRRNKIMHCGVAGLQAFRAYTLLVEDNLFEHIGWRDAELAFESGAIKFHLGKNCLIRRNIFRNIAYAPGIWLDYKSNRNCRITNNVFANITTARGAIYIEVCHRQGRIDHNVFYNLKDQYWLSGDPGAGGSALYTDGSDSLIFDHNFIYRTENAGYTDYINAKRIVGTRGGITRWHRVTHNVFTDCEKHSIEFANKYNYADYNWYSQFNPGYIKIGNPSPPLLLNIGASRKLYNWEKHGKTTGLEVSFNPDKLLLSVSPNKKIKSKQIPGPFKKLNFSGLSIDPRKNK